MVMLYDDDGLSADEEEHIENRKTSPIAKSNIKGKRIVKGLHY